MRMMQGKFKSLLIFVDFFIFHENFSKDSDSETYEAQFDRVCEYEKTKSTLLLNFPRINRTQLGFLPNASNSDPEAIRHNKVSC